MAWPNDEVPGVPAGGFIKAQIRAQELRNDERRYVDRPVEVMNPQERFGLYPTDMSIYPDYRVAPESRGAPSNGPTMESARQAGVSWPGDAGYQVGRPVGYSEDPMDTITVEKGPRRPKIASPPEMTLTLQGRRNQDVPSQARYEWRGGVADFYGQRVPQQPGAYRNGQRMELPSGRDETIRTGQINQDFVNSRAISRGDAAGANLFQSASAGRRAMALGQAGERVMAARAYGGAAAGGLTQKAQGAYIRSLESLTGPQEQERRKQEQAAERIAKASNPPQIVRGEKPEEDKALADARETAIKRYTGGDFNFTGKTKRALEQVISSATAEQLDLLTSLIGSTDQSPEGTKRRSMLYKGFERKYGTEVARELFSLPNAPTKGAAQ